ncbi:uncharacterized protein BXZ73DRAFT_100518 [Epithele typhae]|uniref:uncharacterized protein n=1 Tax=Epithele typhae TaxID=378194 RepID=UPI0020075C5D|nr:uncharacterized protein BXZ73DRAFT_100518 [Epithele typhae]KAH9935125.1 hypothetical protein BXZ73DRAFT_100518 [Epithele typhae]
MSSHAVAMWHCNWNWCHHVFHDKGELRQHLHEAHFCAILSIAKRDWSTYLRSTEGMSGATDSMLAAFQSNAPNTHSPTSPPPHKTSCSSTSNEGTPLSSSRPAKRRKMSFADYAAQSSPTPSVGPVPPSPGLNSIIADALNASAKVNTRNIHPSRINQSPAGASPRQAAATTLRSRPSTSDSSRSSRSEKHPRTKTVHDSPTNASITSSQAVEESLTQLHPASQNRASSSPRHRLQASGTSPRPQAGPSQAPASESTQSQMGSHAVESFPPSLPLFASGSPPSQLPAYSTPRGSPLRPQAAPDLSPGPSFLPPLPRRNRVTSASSTSRLPVAPAPARVLRSRSKTPAPAPPPPVPAKIPLPRTHTRMQAAKGQTMQPQHPSESEDPAAAARAGGRGTSKKPRAPSKPPSTRRTRSSSASTPAAGGRRTRANPNPTDGLTPVDEQPNESPAGDEPAEVEPRLGGFRSGTLSVPRPSSQSSQVSVVQGTSIEVKRELDIGDEPRLRFDIAAQRVPDESQEQSKESQGGGGYVEGYGFDFGSMQLMTQAPYGSQI